MYFFISAWGGGGGAGVSSKGLVHILLMQCFGLGSSEIELFETVFFISSRFTMVIQASFRLCLCLFFRPNFVLDVGKGASFLGLDFLKCGIAKDNRTT